MRRFCSYVALAAAAAASVAPLDAAQAAPTVRQLTPPSLRFGTNGTSQIVFSGATRLSPVTARFLPVQRFDLQATVSPDAGTTITGFTFSVDGTPVTVASGATSTVTTGLNAGLPAGTAVVSARGYSNSAPGIHTLTVTVTQSDSQTTTATGEFEIVAISQVGRRPRNVIYLIGDGMGIAHRTAARLMLRGIQQGKSTSGLAMDSMPVTGIVATASLSSIVTDSAPGAACYSTGNKSNNNQEGVFPDDTASVFDNPRMEYMGEYLARTQNKTLGIVTTSDVFDATPAAFAVHTSNRGAGTGIIDQYLLEATSKANLRVLLGGGRRWFLPNGTLRAETTDTNGRSLLGSSRSTVDDYVLPADIVAAYGVPAGTLNPEANVIDQFTGAGFTYASNKTEMTAAGTPDRLLGLFATGNMNIALDKIAKRRNALVGNRGGQNPSTGGFVVDEYGYPDQPMLDEMAASALGVLNKNRDGFTLMIEGASIDKQAHNMDSDRWMLDTIEFDRAINTVLNFAANPANGETLVVVTADHECAGVNLIGASVVPTGTPSDAAGTSTLEARAKLGTGAAALRTGVVGTSDAAGFPFYAIAADGYPVTTDPDRKLLIGYAANADRYEDWLTNPLPLQDGQSILANTNVGTPPTQPTNQRDYRNAPLSAFPAGPLNRDVSGGFLVTGQIPDAVASHTASDIPVSAAGRGSLLFTGVMDNTDVFFRVMQALLGGAR